jgi:hypothetical protein
MEPNNERLSQAIEGTFLVFDRAIVEAELTGPERRALYQDVMLISSQEENTMREAAELLKLRIGGSVNLRNYVNCLMAGIARDEREATKEVVLEDGADYVLQAGESCWVTVGNASVQIQHGSEGVGVVMYPVDGEYEDSVTETWATWGEFENPDRAKSFSDSCR